MLAICRGHQLLNVGLRRHAAPAHRQRRASRRLPHPGLSVALAPHDCWTPDCRVAEAFGATRFEINSRHHQAVQSSTLGAGLRAVGFADDHGDAPRRGDGEQAAPLGRRRAVASGASGGAQARIPSAAAQAVRCVPRGGAASRSACARRCDDAERHRLRVRRRPAVSSATASHAFSTRMFIVHRQHDSLRRAGRQPGRPSLLELALHFAERRAVLGPELQLELMLQRWCPSTGSRMPAATAIWCCAGNCFTRDLRPAAAEHVQLLALHLRGVAQDHEVRVNAARSSVIYGVTPAATSSSRCACPRLRIAERLGDDLLCLHRVEQLDRGRAAGARHGGIAQRLRLRGRRPQRASASTARPPSGARSCPCPRCLCMRPRASGS